MIRRVRSARAVHTFSAFGAGMVSVALYKNNVIGAARVALCAVVVALLCASTATADIAALSSTSSMRSGARPGAWLDADKWIDATTPGQSRDRFAIQAESGSSSWDGSASDADTLAFATATDTAQGDTATASMTVSALLSDGSSVATVSDIDGNTTQHFGGKSLPLGPAPVAGFGSGSLGFTTAAAPVPGAFLLALFGLGAVVAIRRRQKS